MERELRALSSMAYTKLGLKLRKARKESGLTLREFAQRIGVTPACICNWEHGWRKPPLKFVKMISNALSLDANDLVLYMLE